MSTTTGHLMNPLRDLRTRVLTPSLAQIDPERRGFYPWAEGTSIVTPVGTAFLTGFKIGMRKPTPTDIIRTLQSLERAWLGFAAEGAAMAVSVRAMTEPWNRHAFDRLIAVSGGRHTYMMHVGLGWALARMPRQLWPDLRSLDPEIAPLVLDGYAFHQVFFHTRKTLAAGQVDFPLHLWPGDPRQAQQQLMQGLGRGLWFVCGGSERVLADRITDYDTRWHPALWAGVGLAMTYAGGRTRTGLNAVMDLAGPHLPWVRQGSAFAIEARVLGETVTDHTVLAANVICERDVTDLADLVRRHRPAPSATDGGDWTVYEQWRTRIAKELSDA